MENADQGNNVEDDCTDISTNDTASGNRSCTNVSKSKKNLHEEPSGESRLINDMETQSSKQPPITVTPEVLAQILQLKQKLMLQSPQVQQFLSEQRSIVSDTQQVSKVTGDSSSTDNLSSKDLHSSVR